MIRCRRPTVTASSFECTCSFIMMFWTWVRRVLREMNSFVADVRGGHALGQRLQDLQLARGEGLDGGPFGLAIPGARDALGDAEDHRARQQRLARAGAAHRGDHVVDRAVLGQVAVGAGLDRLEHRLVVLHGREHHDPRAGPARLDRPGRVGAGAVRQPVVHEDDVHPLLGEVLGIGDAGPDPHDLDVRLRGEQACQGIGQELMVVDEQDPDRPSVGGHAASIVDVENMSRSGSARPGLRW